MTARHYHHSAQNCVLGFHMFKTHVVFEVAEAPAGAPGLAFEHICKNTCFFEAAEAPAGAPGLAFGLKMLVYVHISVCILYVRKKCQNLKVSESAPLAGKMFAHSVRVFCTP